MSCAWLKDVLEARVKRRGRDTWVNCFRPCFRRSKYGLSNTSFNRPAESWSKPNWLNLHLAADDSKHKIAGSEQLNSNFPEKVKVILPDLSGAFVAHGPTLVISVNRPSGVPVGPPGFLAPRTCQSGSVG